MNKVQHLTQAYSQAPWRKQIQFIVLFSAVLVFIALIAGVYLSVTARAAEIGFDILAMQSEMKDLRRINSDLQTQLAILTSSKVMEERALDLGFEPVGRDEMIYLVVPGYNERQGAVLAAPPEPVTTIAATLPPDFTESLFDWLRTYIAEQSSRWMEARP